MTPSSGKRLRVLLVEDSERDAAHITLVLRRGGYDPLPRRVETREEMGSALEEPWDVILSDYSLPQFSAAESLQLVRDAGLDTPFLVVSGAIAEETAIELMRLGAHDYLLKDRLARLPAAVEREIGQAEQRRARRRNERLFQAVLRGSPHPAAVVDRDSGRIIDCSESFAREFLHDVVPGEELLLLSAIHFSHGERVSQLLARGSGTAWYTVYYSGEVSRIANVRCYSVDFEGKSFSHVVLEDVTDQNYLKTAFDAIGDVVLIVGSDERLLYANHSAEQLFGSLYFRMEIAPLLASRASAGDWWRTELPRGEERQVEIDGKPFAASTVMFRFAGETTASVIITLRNVLAEQELLQLATHDALTGIYNLRHFDSALAGVVEGVSRGGNAVLVLLDLDYFKPINDELGHDAGDEALKLFTEVVKSQLESDDVFARIGGDEFAIILRRREAPATFMTALFKRLAERPLRYRDQERRLSVSAGVAAIRTKDDPASARDRADKALYAAKRDGRGRFVVAGDDSEHVPPAATPTLVVRQD